jgi:hypothetical protein
MSVQHHSSEPDSGFPLDGSSARHHQPLHRLPANDSYRRKTR